MVLSKRVIETLVDLVEIKLSCFEIYDREDAREQAALEQCRDELLALVQGPGQPGARRRPAPASKSTAAEPAPETRVVAFAGPARSRRARASA